MKTSHESNTKLYLKKKMEEHEHTPLVLAELLGVSVQAVNGWLGKRKGVSKKYAEKLEALYGESIDALLAEIENEMNVLQVNTSVALQPTSDKVAQVNFLNTIAQPVELSEIEMHLTKERYAKLKNIYPNGECYIWGVRNGKGSNMPTRKQYEKLNVNDVVLFYQDGRFYAKSRVTFLMTSPSLSAQIWSGDDTFSNIYFVEKVEAFNLDVVQFNKVVYGKEQKFPVMGFKVLDEKQSTAVLKGFELDTLDDYSLNNLVNDLNVEEDEDKTHQKLLEALLKLESKDALTTDAKGQGREEQQILRKLLYGKKDFAKCECCKKEFPVSYMRTAHIKKRKYASDAEKLDENIVFSLCVMCDLAFEKGDLYVEDGLFKVTDRDMPEDLRSILSFYHNTSCDCFNEKNRQYFSWHKDYHFLKVPTK